MPCLNCLPALLCTAKGLTCATDGRQIWAQGANALFLSSYIARNESLPQNSLPFLNSHRYQHHGLFTVLRPVRLSWISVPSEEPHRDSLCEGQWQLISSLKSQVHSEVALWFVPPSLLHKVSIQSCLHILREAQGQISELPPLGTPCVPTARGERLSMEDMGPEIMASLAHGSAESGCTSW